MVWQALPQVLSFQKGNMNMKVKKGRKGEAVAFVGIRNEYGRREQPVARLRSSNSIRFPRAEEDAIACLLACKSRPQSQRHGCRVERRC